MESWAGSLVPQSLGSRKGKENLEPKKPQDLQNPGPMNKDKREDQRLRHEEQEGKVPPQKCPRKPPERQLHDCKELTESCGFLRVKCKDCGAFGHTARSRRCPMKSWAGSLAPQSLGSRKGKENLEPKKPQDLQNPGPVNKDKREDQKLRPLPHPLQACTMSPHPSPSPGPGQPLRMVFRRLDNSWWSSRFVTVPSSHPPEKPASPVESPPVLGKSEGRCPRVAVSVLYEDLQVSSPSEDSDQE
ncbi:putative protein FAM90A8P [Carlito syrichta]|uniref:Zinc knuckle domain-containing protein n=1 Tax=Carlito syrichta TaxID=1868482 RepID=A0A3Q0DQW3_CARSF|nr:putative protein FAM90A8P [Carlito syrichta]